MKMKEKKETNSSLNVSSSIMTFGCLYSEAEFDFRFVILDVFTQVFHQPLSSDAHRACSSSDR